MRMRDSSIDFANESRRPVVANTYAYEPTLNTASRISAAGRVAARYLGSRKNLFDLRRAASIQNIETIHLRMIQAEKRKAA